MKYVPGAEVEARNDGNERIVETNVDNPGANRSKPQVRTKGTSCILYFSRLHLPIGFSNVDQVSATVVLTKAPISTAAKMSTMTQVPVSTAAQMSTQPQAFTVANQMSTIAQGSPTPPVGTMAHIAPVGTVVPVPTVAPVPTAAPMPTTVPVPTAAPVCTPASMCTPAPRLTRAQVPTTAQVLTVAHMPTAAHVPTMAQLPTVAQVLTTAQVPTMAQVPTTAQLPTTAQVPASAQVLTTAPVPMAAQGSPHLVYQGQHSITGLSCWQWLKCVVVQGQTAAPRSSQPHFSPAVYPGEYSIIIIL